MKRAYIWVLAAAISVAPEMIAIAQQAASPTAAYQTMLSDYRTLEGANMAALGASEHFKASLQAALDQVVKDQQKSAADLRAADERLAWVLDNWVKP